MDTITYNGRSYEVNHLANFDYKQLFNWSSLKDTHFLTLEDIPEMARTLYNFFHYVPSGAFFELENGGGIFNFKHPGYTIHGYKTSDALYVWNSSEIIRYRETDSVYVDAAAEKGAYEMNSLLRELFLKVPHGAIEINHYKYLEMVLPVFADIYPDYRLSEGYISAHGDKAYGYKRTWENAGVPFNRGTLLFLLTYTIIMDRPKHESCEWVIDNYPQFVQVLKVIEDSVGFPKPVLPEGGC